MTAFRVQTTPAFLSCCSQVQGNKKSAAQIASTCQWHLIWSAQSILIPQQKRLMTSHALFSHKLLMFPRSINQTNQVNKVCAPNGIVAVIKTKQCKPFIFWFHWHRCDLLARMNWTYHRQIFSHKLIPPASLRFVWAGRASNHRAARFQSTVRISLKQIIEELVGRNIRWSSRPSRHRLLQVLVCWGI